MRHPGDMYKDAGNNMIKVENEYDNNFTYMYKICQVVRTVIAGC